MLQTLITYAYPLMIPLALIEGPLVALAAGVGASMGRINPLYAYLIVMGGGLSQDVVYCWLGRWTIGSPAVRACVTRTRLARDTFRPLQSARRDEMFMTLIASKFAYGLYAPILVSAGMAKAPFWRFLGESMALSAIVLAAWLGLGFGLGRSYALFGRYASWAMAGLGLLAIIGLVFIARHARRHLARRGGAAR